MKPTRKMILAQNLLFNCLFVLVMVAVTNIINGQSFGPETTGMIIIGFVVMELLGLVIPVKKISGFLGEKLFHGQNPMREAYQVCFDRCISFYRRKSRAGIKKYDTQGLYGQDAG